MGTARCHHAGRTPYSEYWLLRGRLYALASGERRRVLSLCLDDPDQGPVVVLPVVTLGGDHG